MNKALISLACGFVSGVASAALPGVGGLVAGVVVGTVEESLTADNNYEEFRADLTVSTAVDLLSGVSSEESRITKQVVQEYRKAIPKSKAGNHPVVKSAAKKVKKKFGVMAGKEIGTGVAQKSFWGVLKKGLQAIF